MKKEISQGIIRRFNHQVGPGAFEVYIVMWSGADERGEFSEGADWILKRTGFSRSKLFRTLAQLYRLSYISRRPRRTREGRVIYVLKENLDD